MALAGLRCAPIGKLTPYAAAAAILFFAMPGSALADDATLPKEATSAKDDKSTVLDPISVSGDWLGSGLQNSVKTFAGARDIVDKKEIEQSGATSIGDVMRRIPGVQATDNSGTAGSSIS